MAKPLILNKPVIAITGSAGKTTTKEMIAAILEQKWKILKTSGNANAPRHTAMYADKIKPWHQALVLEYGMSVHGEIRRSCQIIQPNIGIVTNVGTAHIGHFNGDIRGIANTKSDLIRYMKKTGLLIINADDKNSKLLDTKSFKGKILTIGQNSSATFKAENIQYGKSGMNFQTKINGKLYDFYIPSLGKHNIYNALFAIAATNHLGFKPEEIQKGLKVYKKPRRRLSVYKFNNNIKIIDDTFSSNPNAAKAAIDVLQYQGNGRKIAVLGTMLEMGNYKVNGHKDVGKYLAKKKINKLYTYGSDALYIGKGAIEAGYPKGNVRSFTSKDKLIGTLLKEITPKTTILFKASHGVKMNEIVNELVKEYKRKKTANY